VLIYPVLGGDRSRGSYLAHAEAPMLTLRDVAYYEMVRTGGHAVTDDPTLMPLTDTDFSGLPPTVVVSAECDPLSSDGEAYCERIRAAGGKAVWFNEAGLVHGYLRARHSVGRARESFNRIVSALDALAYGCWPYASPAA
jgi:acetyl esterase